MSYSQVLHEYLNNDEIECDSETAIKLGCLELRYVNIMAKKFYTPVFLWLHKALIMSM